MDSFIGSYRYIIDNFDTLKYLQINKLIIYVIPITLRNIMLVMRILNKTILISIFFVLMHFIFYTKQSNTNYNYLCLIFMIDFR